MTVLEDGGGIAEDEVDGAGDDALKGIKMLLSIQARINTEERCHDFSNERGHQQGECDMRTTRINLGREELSMTPYPTVGWLVGA